jgi:hypothetical protein
MGRPTACFAGSAILVIVGTVAAQTFNPNITRAWDDKEVEGLEVPLAARDRSPRYPNAAEYYSLKERTIYRSYPVYVEGKEPPGYIESLRQREPEIIFDASKLGTKEDWIQAGKVVFEAEISFSPAPARPGGTRLPPGVSIPVSSAGALPACIPGFSYIVRKKGVLEVGANSCAGCHTRAMPNGSFIEGAQGNLVGLLAAAKLRTSAPTVPRIRENEWLLFGVPWVTKKEEFEKLITLEELIRRQEAAAGFGVHARQGTRLVTHILRRSHH